MAGARVPGVCDGCCGVSGKTIQVAGTIGLCEAGDRLDDIVSQVSRYPEPPKIRQPSPTSCWSGAMLSWLRVTGAATPLPRHANPESLIDHYWNKKWTDNRSYLNTDKSMREESEAQAIWLSACSLEGGSNGGAVSTARKRGDELSYDYFVPKLNASHLLVAEKRSDTYKHVFVVYGVLKRTGNWVELLIMDPNGGKYDTFPLAGLSPSYLYWISSVVPCNGTILT